jgi:hypothetical protein
VPLPHSYFGQDFAMYDVSITPQGYLGVWTMGLAVQTVYLIPLEIVCPSLSIMSVNILFAVCKDAVTCCRDLGEDCEMGPEIRPLSTKDHESDQYFLTRFAIDAGVVAGKLQMHARKPCRTDDKGEITAGSTRGIVQLHAL